MPTAYKDMPWLLGGNRDSLNCAIFQSFREPEGRRSGLGRTNLLNNHPHARASGRNPRREWVYTLTMILSIELDREEDGRWIAEAIELPGVMSYGATREEAISNAEKLAIEVIADRIKHGELPPSALSISFQVLREQLAGN